jgi:hypothetical protein
MACRNWLDLNTRSELDPTLPPHTEAEGGEKQRARLNIPALLTCTIIGSAACAALPGYRFLPPAVAYP